jgi:hypothetical protein
MCVCVCMDTFWAKEIGLTWASEGNKTIWATIFFHRWSVSSCA